MSERSRFEMEHRPPEPDDLIVYGDQYGYIKEIVGRGVAIAFFENPRVRIIGLDELEYVGTQDPDTLMKKITTGKAEERFSSWKGKHLNVLVWREHLKRS